MAPKKNNNGNMRKVLRDMNPHRIPNPPNTIPEVSISPWQPRRAHLQISAAAATSVTCAGVLTALQGIVPTSSTAQLRILRIFVYLRNQTTTAEAKNSQLTPINFIVPTGSSIVSRNFGTFTREASVTMNAAIGFDYGLTIHNTPVVALSSLEIASVIGSDVYVDVLFRDRS